MRLGKIVFYFTALLLLTGCKGSQPAVVVQYRDRVLHDTIHDARIDSVYKYEFIKEKGDTVWRIDSVLAFRVLYRDRVQVEHVRDSVPYVQEVQVPVRKRNGYDRFTSWGFWVLFLLLVLRIAWWFVKKYYLRA